MSPHRPGERDWRAGEWRQRRPAAGPRPECPWLLPGEPPRTPDGRRRERPEQFRTNFGLYSYSKTNPQRPAKSSQPFGRLDMRKAGSSEETVEPHIRQLFLDGVLAEPRGQVGKVHAIDL